jgi:hypothetical protein
MPFTTFRRSSFAFALLAASSVPTVAQQIKLPEPITVSPSLKQSICASHADYVKVSQQMDAQSVLEQAKNLSSDLYTLRTKRITLAEQYPGVKDAITEAYAENLRQYAKKEPGIDTAKRSEDIRISGWQRVEQLCR